MIVRCGIGYDVHRLAEGRKLILGGVEIAHSRGLEGHSDADVLSHAIADALLGAIGAGDIGQHFPNTDASIRGISSLEILMRVTQLLAAKKSFATPPRSSPFACPFPARKSAAPAHPESPGAALSHGARWSRSLATSSINESLGAIGRGEGIAAMAMASVEVE